MPVPEYVPARDMEELRDRMLRLQADFDNFRRRMAREKQELYPRATADVLQALLPVVDHMELGLQHATQNEGSQALLEGLRLVQDQLVSVLRRFGLEPIDAEGTLFDPTVHEAIAHLPSDTVPAEHVITQTRRGYRMSSTLLRPAQVIVSSGPAAVPTAADAANGSPV